MSVHTETNMEDTYSQEIINQARSLSPAIEEYIMTQAYLQETAVENLTPEWFRNRLVRLVLEELESVGIGIAMEIDAMLDSPELVMNVMTLRAKFDPDVMFDFLKAHPDVADEVREMLEEDCISDVIEYMHLTFPLDESWDALMSLLENHPGFLTSNDKFVELFESVFERLDSLGDPDMITTEGNVVIDYTKALAERRGTIRKVARAIYAEGYEGSGTKMIAQAQRAKAVDAMMLQFEVELARPRYIKEFADYNGTFRQFLFDVRQPFLKNWRHTLEYWMSDAHRNEMPNELNIAILVATEFVDAADQAHARVAVLKKFEDNVDLFGPKAADFRGMLDAALSNLVVLNGGVFYGTK